MDSPGYPHSRFYDDFDLSIHILYDGTRPLELPEWPVGVATAKAALDVFTRG
ncbi:hypothetical protein [Prauserella cavernicola]|uniref:Uncharacterized protein n=1 Tax=Prauserella cavernicola TaxID=2800127 RepID=A0A934QRA2_9PSEU|nr:hypothetical protein [Prauserella cavernicola]MBK1783959.1 hypothetical protein [Prauserella cavernicola]